MVRDLSKEKSVLWIAATGFFVVFTLFGTQLFSTIVFTERGGFTRLVEVGNPYHYLVQQASAQEEGVLDENTTEVNQPPTEESLLSSSSSPPSRGAVQFVPPSQEQEAVEEEQLQSQPPTPTDRNVTSDVSSEQDAETIIICGWVFNDMNQNRKRDTGERGIEGATVTLQPASRGASIDTGSFKTKTYGDYCISGGRSPTEDMPVSFFVTVTPPERQFTPSTPGNVQTPVVFTPTTELVVTVGFDESDVLSKEVNFGFRQVEVWSPEV
jgi:hypothetical protein